MYMILLFSSASRAHGNVLYIRQMTAFDKIASGTESLNCNVLPGCRWVHGWYFTSAEVSDIVFGHLGVPNLCQVKLWGSPVTPPRSCRRQLSCLPVDTLKGAKVLSLVRIPHTPAILICQHIKRTIINWRYRISSREWQVSNGEGMQIHILSNSTAWKHDALENTRRPLHGDLYTQMDKWNRQLIPVLFRWDCMTVPWTN